MTSSFETEKNRKALLYTVVTCITLLLLFVLIKWKHVPVNIPIVQDLIEINLGNDDEGFGENQPLIKGNRTPDEAPKQNPSSNEQAATAPDKIAPEDDAPEDAAPLNKPVKKAPSLKNEQVETKATPKPQKPRLTYPGVETGKPGNNPNEENAFPSQGRKPGATKDDGSLDGAKDAFGKNPGGKVGGPKVIRGSRKITNTYTFKGELKRATINAIIKVSPAGTGLFIGFDKGSNETSQAYATAISQYLSHIKFDTAEEESTVTVQFKFRIN